MLITLILLLITGARQRKKKQFNKPGLQDAIK